MRVWPRPTTATLVALTLSKEIWSALVDTSRSARTLVRPASTATWTSGRPSSPGVRSRVSVTVSVVPKAERRYPGRLDTSVLLCSPI